MQLRADQLPRHLAQGLRTLYTVYGDEPLLAQEAMDAIRACARVAGHTERSIHTVGQHFDWGAVLGAASALSLFADRQLMEVRIPSGKPGKDGSEALQKLCAQITAHGGDDIVMLLQLPRMDRTAMSSAWFTALGQAGVLVRVDPVERAHLPAWIAQRLAGVGLRVADGVQGQQTLAFFADRVEGNLLAAHQEIQKLALLYPPEPEAGPRVLSFEEVESAVLNVARYDVFKFGEAVLAGQVERVVRMLDGLKAEGEAAVLVHWTMAEDIRALLRVREAVDQGRPLAFALRDNRVWGVREKLFERLLPSLSSDTVAGWVQAAHEVDGIVKGLKLPHWPADEWQALQQLALRVARRVGGAVHLPQSAHVRRAPAARPPA